MGSPNVASLILQLAEPNTRCVWHAADALAEMGPAAVEAVPALVAAIAAPAPDPEPGPPGAYHMARMACGIALVRIGSPDAAEPLERLLASKDLNVVWTAHHSIEALGPRALGALPGYRRQLRNPRPGWRIRSVTILGLLAGVSPEALALVEGACGDADPRVAGCARCASSLAGANVDEALSATRTLLESEDEDVRRAGRTFALHLMRRTPAAVVPLVKAWPHEPGGWQKMAFLMEALPPESLRNFIEALRLPESRASARSAVSLCSSNVLPLLVEALADEEIGDFAASLLGARKAIPLMRDVVHSGDARVRVRGILAWSRVAQRAAEEFLFWLRHPQRRASLSLPLVEMLKRHRDDYPELAESVKVFADSLRDPDATVRIHAAVALGLLDVEGESALDALESGERDAEPRVGDACSAALVHVLGRLGDRLPAVFRCFTDPLARVRRNAIEALWAAQAQGAEVVAAARVAAGEPDIPSRIAALRVLGLAGSAHDAELLADRCRDEAEEVRQAALSALAHVAPHEPRTLAVLTAALTDSEDDMRGTAAEELGNLGARARMAIDALVELARSGSEASARMDALKALHRIDGTDSRVQAVTYELLRDGESGVRQTAAVSLVGSDPTIAVETFVGLLSHEADDVRYQAIEELVKLGPAAGTAVSALARTVSDPEASVRMMACVALAKIGAAAAGAVPTLRQALEDSDEIVREAAAEALEVLAGPSP